MERHVVPLDAPAPCAARRWRSENREEVSLGVAQHRITSQQLCGSRPLRGLQRTEDIFEIHDLSRRHVAALAQTGFQEIVRERALRLAHLLDRQAVPRKLLRRNEVAMRPLGAVDTERRLLAL